MKKVFFSILFIIIILVLGFLWQEGFFSPVQITEGNTGPYFIVYEDYIGDYKKTGPVMDSLYQRLFIDGIQAVRGIGIYYDNPKEVVTEKLYSQIGMIVEREDYKRLADVENNYSVKHVPLANSVITEFSYRNKISILLGIYKIYPPLTRYIEEKGYVRGPIIEVYDKLDKRIYYIMNIED